MHAHSNANQLFKILQCLGHLGQCALGAILEGDAELLIQDRKGSKSRVATKRLCIMGFGERGPMPEYWGTTFAGTVCSKGSNVGSSSDVELLRGQTLVPR